ncbi:MAG TPA: DUF6788 family protein [Trebonia sp.]|nr:DUF6788 family protein [Trebonia sp.]
MSEPSLPELEAERTRLFAQLVAVGDFRRGSVSENYRKCGKPNCACAAPDHPGHGPRFLWTRPAGRRKTAGRQLAAAEVEKVRREIARHAEFTSAVEQVIEVNEKICEARPAAGADAGQDPSGTGGENGHEAVFAAYREKTVDTVLGPVTLRRAWYHCAECGHGLAPRDAGLGVAGASMSPGLAAMNDLAAAAGPFAGAARLLEELAGIRLAGR